jgi:hypothetical protein
MSSIFHYTDADGLLGILSTNSLYATHYKYPNDITEAATVRELLLPILESEIAVITPKLQHVPTGVNRDSQTTPKERV